jgi:hypothetical protein
MPIVRGGWLLSSISVEAACSDDVLWGSMIQRLHAKDQDQTNHPRNLASAYAMFLSEDDTRKIGLDYVHSNAANSSLKRQNEAVVRHYGALAEVLAAQWNNLCGIDSLFIELTIKGKNCQIQIISSSASLALDLAKKFYGLCLPLWQANMEMWASWTLGLEKLALLAEKVIRWDKGFDDPERETHIISIDGADMMAWERKNAYLLKDPAFCFHKSNGCAYRYMIAVSVYWLKILGIYGPYPGSYSEIKIFQEHIKTKIKQGKYAVANKGNKDSSIIMLALPIPVDNWDNKKFKACVLARHEMVNRQIKLYNSMADTWKHGMDKHVIAIRAVAATAIQNGQSFLSSSMELMQQASAANKITTV